jgi:hypothetical protein
MSCATHEHEPCFARQAARCSRRAALPGWPNSHTGRTCAERSSRPSACAAPADDFVMRGNRGRLELAESAVLSARKPHVRVPECMEIPPSRRRAEKRKRLWPVGQNDLAALSCEQKHLARIEFPQGAVDEKILAEEEDALRALPHPGERGVILEDFWGVRENDPNHKLPSRPLSTCS